MKLKLSILMSKKKANNNNFSSSGSSAVASNNQGLIQKFLALHAQDHYEVIMSTLPYGKLPEVYKSTEFKQTDFYKNSVFTNQDFWIIIYQFIYRNMAETTTLVKAIELMKEHLNIKNLGVSTNGSLTLTHIAACYNNKKLFGYLEKNKSLDLYTKDQFQAIPIQYTNPKFKSGVATALEDLSEIGKLLFAIMEKTKGEQQTITLLRNIPWCQTTIFNTENTETLESLHIHPEDSSDFFVNLLDNKEYNLKSKFLSDFVKNTYKLQNETKLAVIKTLSIFRPDACYNIIKESQNYDLLLTQEALVLNYILHSCSNHQEDSLKWSELIIEKISNSSKKHDFFALKWRLHKYIMLESKKNYNFEKALDHSLGMINLYLERPNNNDDTTSLPLVEHAFYTILSSSSNLGQTEHLAKLYNKLKETKQESLAAIVEIYFQSITHGIPLSDLFDPNAKTVESASSSFTSNLMPFQPLRLQDGEFHFLTQEETLTLKIYHKIYSQIKIDLTLKYFLSNGLIAEAYQFCKPVDLPPEFCFSSLLTIKALDHDGFQEYITKTEQTYQNIQDNLQWNLGKIIASIYHDKVDANTYNAIEKVQKILNVINSKSTLIKDTFAKACHLIAKHLLSEDDNHLADIEKYLDLAEKYGAKDTNLERANLAIKQGDLKKSLLELTKLQKEEADLKELQSNEDSALQDLVTQVEAIKISADIKTTTTEKLKNLANHSFLKVSKKEYKADLKNAAKHLLLNREKNISEFQKSELLEFKIKDKTYKTSEKTKVYKINDQPDIYAAIDEEVFISLEKAQQTRCLASLGNGLYRGKNQVIWSDNYFKIKINSDLRLYSTKEYKYKIGNKHVYFVLFDKKGDHEAIERLNEAIEIHDCGTLSAATIMTHEDSSSSANIDHSVLAGDYNNDE